MKRYNLKYLPDGFPISINAIDLEDALNKITSSGVTKKEDWEFVSEGPPMIYNYIRHVVSEMQDLVQRCVICGKVLSDYRGAMTDTPGPIKGFPAGTLFVYESTNPTVFTLDIPDDGCHFFKECNI